MKKYYALLALATAMTASAAVPANSVKIEEATANFNVNSIDISQEVNASDILKAPAVGGTSGFWGFTYYGMSNSDNFQHLRGVQLEKVSATEVKIYGLGLFGGNPVTAAYDASAQTLTIKKQTYLTAAQMSEISGGDINEAIMLLPCKIANNMMVETTSVVFQYCPEGVTMGEQSGIYEGGWVVLGKAADAILCFNTMTNFNAQGSDGNMSGWQGSWKYSLAIPPMGEFWPNAPGFTYEPSEWTSVGNAKFKDGWGVLDGADAYDVPAYQNKENKNLFMLLNPYGVNTPYAQYNGNANDEGYIVFDVTNPNVVVVMPHVFSGLSLPDWDLQSVLAVTNREGVKYYLQDYDLDEIEEEAIMYDDPLSTYDAATGEIVLPNCVFQNVPYFDTEDMDNWSVEGTPIDMITNITLPEGVQGGINGITNDVNVAPRYFNLQGVEISNPVNGEVVIVKEGSKATKTIVR